MRKLLSALLTLLLGLFLFNPNTAPTGVANARHPSIANNVVCDAFETTVTICVDGVTGERK